MSNIKAPFSHLILTFIVFLAFSTCFNDWLEDSGTIVINLGGNNAGGRSSLYPPQDFEILEQLVYEIVLSGNEITIEISANGGDIIRRSVTAGEWNIQIDAFYKGKHYATGSNSITVIAGMVNAVLIPMQNLNLICPDCAVDSLEPTCEEAGWETVTCEFFEEHNSKISIEPLAHNYPKTIPATCTTNSIPQNCAFCNFQNPETVVNALGHNWNYAEHVKWEVTKPPTIKEEGEEIRKCLSDGCDEKQTRAIEKLYDISQDVFAYYWINQLGELATTNMGSSTIQLSAGNTLTITANDTGYINHQWLVNGIMDTAQIGTTYIFSAAGRTAGSQYTISLLVENNGRFYNTNFVVLITE